MSDAPHSDAGTDAERAVRDFYDKTVLNVEGDETRYGSVVGMAFGDARTHHYGDVALAEVRHEWREADKRARRALVLAGSVGVAFVLAGAGNVSELTIAGVKADAQGIDLIVKFLPAVAIALAAEAMVLTRLVSEYQALYRSLLKRLHPNLLWGHLDFAIAPQSMSFFGGDWTVLIGRYRDSAASWWLLGIGLVNALLLGLAPLAFLIYAYGSLFDRFDTSDAFVWASLVIASLNTARYVASAVDREDRGPAPWGGGQDTTPTECRDDA